MKKVSFVNSKVELSLIKCVLRVINNIKWILYEEQYNGYERIILIQDLYEIIQHLLSQIKSGATHPKQIAAARTIRQSFSNSFAMAAFIFIKWCHDFIMETKWT